MGETSTPQVWRGIGFFPCNGVDYLEADTIGGESKAKKAVMRSRDPDNASGLENSVTFSQPSEVKQVVSLNSL
jgi:hypothetical protein